MRIFVRPAIETAHEAPIQNRHFDPVDTRLHLEISGPPPKFLSGSVVAGCRCDRKPTPLRSTEHNFLLGRMRIFVRPAIGTARKASIQNRHFDPSVEGCIRRFSVQRPNSSLGAWSWAADVIAYGHPFAQTGITFRSVIRIAYKTPIRNRHLEAPVASLWP
ncbi:hypothetical protein Taro_049971 [Colocasia esculenta]|uniref:Uncharacterized protein n=1 Tax=Colocasia esculenta TaxID=4460 RepID=A0A843XCG5_COLES|nr:hypothetical protein [Colocasia esculenta]